MKSRSSKYTTPDAGGWMHKADDLFLAQYRGKPCEICGKTHGWDEGKTTSSCGHHLIFKGKCRKHRYEPKNIVVLCPEHHSHWNQVISPHSMTSTIAQQKFADWIKITKPDQWEWWQAHQEDANKPFDKSWTYREKYVELGGEIESKTGKMKDLKPKNHAAKIRERDGRKEL